MSLTVPSCHSAPRCLYYMRTSLPIRTRRAISSTASRKADEKKSEDDASNPYLDEYRRQNPAATEQQRRPEPGDISSSSVFEDERRAELQREDDDQPSDSTKAKVGGQVRDKKTMRKVLDPDPNARERWERKKVIQTIRKGGRLSKALFLKRTEREHLAKSHSLKTSVKKLGKLARQIAGKPVDDAITQMRFSKKKVATEVLKHLEFARDEAVVMRGMGLGKVKPESEAGEAEILNETSPDIAGAIPPEAQEGQEGNKAMQIQLKDGKRHVVTDKSQIYIDQAWVGRGPYGKLPDYRAKGKINVMRTPFTSISFLLKEETTRVREWEEREAKRRKKRMEKVWVPLPDRPIQVKTQWYSW